MTKRLRTIETGVPNLDAILGGGLPAGSISVISGSPGSGKTILAQQICFHQSGPKKRILYFNTLSEPTAKTLRYLEQFAFFDADKIDRDFAFVDLGGLLRSSGLEKASSLIMERLKKVKPSMVVIDSFKAFDDLSRSREELRKFGYEIAVNLMAWEVTGLLLGEYAVADHETNPLFSVVDGLIRLSQRESWGEQQRFAQVLKMRGIDQSRDEHPFIITSNGIELFAPKVTIQREEGDEDVDRCKTGIANLDALLGDGIPRGSSLLVAGVAGTGKTVLLLEFLYRGAEQGEKGILFSFEETPARLLATAAGLGWDLAGAIARGMIELVFIPQPAIVVEQHLAMMRERIAAFGARRVAIDSISVFLHKVTDPQVSREKTFQLASIVQNTGAVGLFATDIPYGSNQISRFGVEETVVDGVILLSSSEEGFERQRYIEVYKLRNTAHSKGRHSMVIGHGGLRIFPRYADVPVHEPPPPLAARRIASGVAGLDDRMGGGLLERSVTLVAGSPGTGKTTLGNQFIVEGAERGERGMIFTLEESPEQLLAMADALGLPLRKWVKQKLVEIVYLSHQHARAAQFLSIIGDGIRKHRARRVFLDSVGHIVHDEGKASELRELLYKLAHQNKSLDVTTVLSVESASLYFGDDVTERGFSPVADNLLMLRYVQRDDSLHPALRIVKTRGSEHDEGTYPLQLAKGGIRLAERPTAKGAKGAKKRRR